MAEQQPCTPAGSEVDAFEYWMTQAEILYEKARYGKIKDKAYIQEASRLDAIPGIGKYYRHLCSNAPTILRLDKLIRVQDGENKITEPW